MRQRAHPPGAPSAEGDTLISEAMGSKISARFESAAGVIETSRTSCSATMKVPSSSRSGLPGQRSICDGMFFWRCVGVLRTLTLGIEDWRHPIDAGMHTTAGTRARADRSWPTGPICGDPRRSCLLPTDHSACPLPLAGRRSSPRPEALLELEILECRIRQEALHPPPQSSKHRAGCCGLTHTHTPLTHAHAHTHTHTHTLTHSHTHHSHIRTDTDTHTRTRTHTLTHTHTHSFCGLVPTPKPPTNRRTAVASADEQRIAE